jgi:hypothetical protein
MSKSLRFLTLPAYVMLGILLSACQGMSFKNEPVSVRALVPVGSKLTLKQPLEIPEERSSIWIYRGKVEIYKNVDVYYPHCQFRMQKVSKSRRVVQPDSFVITKINEWEDYTYSDHIRVAGLDVVDARISGSVGIGVGGGAVAVGAGVGDGGPSLIKYATILSLKSGKQPQVKEMVCLHWGDRGMIEALTLEETRGALGSLFSIEVGKQ